MTQPEQRNSWACRIGCFVLGVLMALGHAPTSNPFFLVLVLPFVIWLATERPVFRPAFGVGYWVGLGYFALSLIWIVEPFLVEPEIFGWMAPFGLFFMAGGMALFWGLSFGLAVKIGRSKRKKVVLLVCFWALAEYLRGHILTGFPWALPAYLWTGTGVAQTASILGAYGLTFLTMAILAIPAFYREHVWHGAAYSGVIIMLVWVWGEWRVPNQVKYPDEPSLVRLIQPNAQQHLKWRSDMIPVFYKRAIGYTAAKTPQSPNIVIWPETALPFALGDNPNALQAVADAAGPNTDVLAGIRRRGGDGGYNSAAYLDHFGGVLATYDKHHLVPFGEYLPFNTFFVSIGLQAIADNIGGYTSGDGPRVIKGNKVPDFLPLICYEAIFPAYSHSETTRPSWLVLMTNDAWFGTFSGPYQHLAIAQMRAIEQGLPLARAANTGVSAMIDPYGRITKSLKLNQSGYIDAALPAVAKPTWFSVWQDKIWLIFVIVLAVATLLPKGSLITVNRRD